MTRLLGTGDEIIPLSQEEVELLLKLGKEEQLVAMSTGIIENDRVRILTGPLQDMEGYIRKINRHKRKAWVSIEMFGRSVDMEVGLEIIKNDGIFTGKRFCKYVFLDKKEGEVRKTYVQEKIKRMV